MQEITVNEDGDLVRSEVLPLDRNPAAVYLAGLSEGSRRTMRGALDKVAGMLTGGRCDAASLAWGRMRYPHVKAVRSKLKAEYAASTVNKHLSAIRGVLAEAYRLGQMTAEAYRRAVDVESVKGKREPTGRMLSSQEIAALLAACTDDPSPAGARDAAIIALAAVAGPRRSEIVGLDVESYDPQTGGVTIRNGKGNKDRTVYVDNGAKDALDDWLALRGRIEGPLFVPVHQSGKMRIDRLTPQVIYSMLRKRAAEAGIEDATPHDLRRTALSNLIDETDLSTAQKIAGHSDPRTTARYDRRGERAKQAAAARMDVEYRGFR